MRTFTIDSVSVSAPDTFQFAFGTIPLLCEWTSSGVKSVSVDLSSSGKAYTDTRTPVLRSGKYYCLFDIAAYVRAAMSDDPQPFYGSGFSNMTRSFTYSVTISYTGGTSTMSNSYTFTAVWGACNTDEVFNQDCEVHYWQGFPSVITAYMATTSSGSSNSTITRTTGNNTSTQTIHGTGIRFLAINNSTYGVSDKIEIVSPLTTKYYLDPDNGVVAYDVDEKHKTINIVKHEGVCDGVFLRWVDKFGLARYWVFRRGRDQYAVANESSSLRSEIEYGAANGYNSTGVIVEQKAAARKIVVGYPNATKSEIDILLTLLSSPYVEMLLPFGGYARVTIQAGTATFNQASLQEFSCTIILPNEEIQSL